MLQLLAFHVADPLRDLFVFQRMLRLAPHLAFQLGEVALQLSPLLAGWFLNIPAPSE